jgi:hypothetical protein
MTGDPGAPIPDRPEALRVLPGGAVVAAEGPLSSPSFLYLDCGAWMGDGRDAAAQRSFAVVCGPHAVLCEFRAGRALRLPPAEDPAAQAIQRLLSALAGPQRMDVAVHRWSEAPSAEDPGRAPAPTLFLPDLHLPLVGKMPDLDPDLVPDPALSRCWCHGPIFARIDGRGARVARYRAVGSRVTRNPNDWFYALAASHDAAAADLGRLLDRLLRHAAAAPLHLVQLGGLFDVWAGYKCVFHGRGVGGFVEPNIVTGVGEAEYHERWQEMALPGKPKDALTRLFRFPPERRTLLSAGHGHFGPEGSPWPPGPRRLRTATFLAENRPEPLALCTDDPPHARIGVYEGRAHYVPWQRTRRPGWREELVAAAAARWAEDAFPVYVMAHTYEPCLVEVRVEVG